MSPTVHLQIISYNSQIDIRLQAVPFCLVERSREKNWSERAEGGLGGGSLFSFIIPRSSLAAL